MRTVRILILLSLVANVFVSLETNIQTYIQTKTINSKSTFLLTSLSRFLFAQLVNLFQQLCLQDVNLYSHSQFHLFQFSAEIYH